MFWNLVEIYVEGYVHLSEFLGGQQYHIGNRTCLIFLVAMTQYQSILPSSSGLDEEYIPLTYQTHNSYERPSQCRWYLWIPAFLFGVFSVAALFVWQSLSRNATIERSTTPPQQPEVLPDFVQVEQWDEWKEELVQAAQKFRADVTQAWAYEGSKDAEFLQDTWSPEQAQAWWEGISQSTKQWMHQAGNVTQKEAAEAGHWIGEMGNETKQWAKDTSKWAGEHAEEAKEWAQEATSETGQWVGNATEKTTKKAGHMAQDAANSTQHWMKNATSKTTKWAKDEEEKTKEWTEHEANSTGHWIDDEAEKTKKWVGQESKEAGHWIGEEANKTGRWIGEESREAGDWFKKESERTGEAAGGAGHWAGDEAKDVEEWLRKEGNVTEHWVGDEVKRSCEWIGDEAESSKKWFERESNVTERWISEEAKDSANWFRKEARETGIWFKKEENVTGNWVKKQSNRTVHWFEADAEAVRIWWNNITHRDRIQDESLVYFNTTAAFTLLVDGYGWYDSSRDFFTYQEGFDTQENQAYCALAAAAAVVNSFRGFVALPTDPVYKPYPYATQNSIFNECTDKTVIVRNTTFDGVLASPGGLNLDQTKSLLECNLPKDGWSVEAHHVDPSFVSLDDMRKDLVLALMSPASRVIVNFNREAANQIGGGHFSPIGSYSHQRDAFLVMDVAKYKYPYVWIPAFVLYRSLMTVDACGTWNYPDAQVKLKSSHPELSYPQSSRDLTKSIQKLGCKAAYRGYIIVKQL